MYLNNNSVLAIILNIKYGTIYWNYYYINCDV